MSSWYSPKNTYWLDSIFYNIISISTATAIRTKQIGDNEKDGDSTKKYANNKHYDT